MQQIGQVIDHWMEDADFRAAIRANPEKAVAALGLPLTDDDRKTLKNIDWSLTDEQLQSRISSGM